MKTTTTTAGKTAAIALRLLPLAAAALLSNCASFAHPLANHDLDGDGQISDAEYRQSNVRYNMASRQRVDEYSRARLMTAHAHNAADFMQGANRTVNLLQNFGR